MKVVWSPLALERLREAAAFIARDKPGASARWAANAFDAVAALAELPRSGRVVPELRSRCPIEVSGTWETARSDTRCCEIPPPESVLV